MSRDEMDEWLERLLRHERRAVAKLISRVEDDRGREEIMRSVRAHSGKSLVIGITGPPGVGKSSLVEALTHYYREKGERVGIAAVDPSSPYTGGAILGDRIRMQAHTTDRDVFIRSMGTRGHLGGVARSTADVLRILEAGGYGRLLLETVGVGQSEIEIMRLADTVVVVLNPGTGDGIQAIKAGIMEVADIFVVNKSDMPGAERMKNDIEMMLDLNGGAGPVRRPPVVLTSALQAAGIQELGEAIAGQQAFLRESGQIKIRRQVQLQRETWHCLEEKVRSLFDGAWPQIPQDLLEVGERDPFVLVEKVWAKMTGGRDDYER
ncbi:ArgK protein [Acididesulfobacillus acetoxydans]|uniref:ArgK protein n=1 Tax=Acididesulfobacillus acetoxydans TaxID=1561005 RepID=A0A8S0XWU0_9FIRM|nr:methylmalonyl Co-A mutase-associated GTPase MeaB [Acididesulfobacillus acetoxydans]CAA7601267.1 ArgK protein [Acididesulfobacillus acetoxydans]CEJ08454.1 Methylmalonic aciduria type A homolog, mitochondrial [Acididesulfobacillus acetoxydans]